MISNSTQSSNGKNVPARKIIAVIFLVAFLGLQVGVFLLVAKTREWAFDQYSGEDAQQDWNKWVDEATRQAEGDGPIRRRVPKSKQPPALVLARDYYPTCLFGALLFSSLLFVSISYFGWGLMPERSK
jgi:hypothetical protein